MIAHGLPIYVALEPVDPLSSFEIPPAEGYTIVATGASAA